MTLSSYPGGVVAPSEGGGTCGCEGGDDGRTDATGEDTAGTGVDDNAPPAEGSADGCTAGASEPVELGDEGAGLASDDDGAGLRDPGDIATRRVTLGVTGATTPVNDEPR